jgi:hypothetical protein
VSNPQLWVLGEKSQYTIDPRQGGRAGHDECHRLLTAVEKFCGRTLAGILRLRNWLVNEGKAVGGVSKGLLLQNCDITHRPQDQGFVKEC